MAHYEITKDLSTSVGLIRIVRKCTYDNPDANTEIKRTIGYFALWRDDNNQPQTTALFANPNTAQFYAEAAL